MDAIKNELIKRINSYPDSYNKKEMLDRLVMDTKLEESIKEYQENGALSHDEARRMIEKRQTALRSGKILL